MKVKEGAVDNYTRTSDVNQNCPGQTGPRGLPTHEVAELVEVESGVCEPESGDLTIVAMIDAGTFWVWQMFHADSYSHGPLAISHQFTELGPRHLYSSRWPEDSFH